MSTFLNPLHPGTLFVQTKLGQMFLLSAQIVLPPGSTISYALAPPSGKVWIITLLGNSPPRDATTGNPVISPLFTVYNRHSMIVSVNVLFGLEAEFRLPWASEIDLKVNDPINSTIVNGTAFTIAIDFAYSIIEISEEENYDRYMRLWNGLYNLEMILGGLSSDDVINLVMLLKRIGSPVVALEPVPMEKTTAPTMAEDTNGIRRIKIP